jgi:hypothetical protein
VGASSHLRDALQDRALKVQLQHDAKSTSECRVHGDRKVQPEDVAGLEQVLERG